MAGWLLVILSLGAVQGPTRIPAVDWATVAVEREAFGEGQPGQYATVGKFDGIGMLYLSVTKRLLEFKGLRRISVPYLGQQPENAYEIHHETFAISSIIRVSDNEYAFEGVSDGPFRRSVTGKLRYSVARSGLGGTVEEFQLDEHGQVIKGIMNRYSIAKSAQGVAMLKKYAEVFLGGNFVALDFER